MDLVILVGIAIALFLIILTTLFFVKKKESSSTELPNEAQVRRGVPVRAQEGIPRRAQIARNQRNRLRGATAVLPSADEDNARAEGEGNSDDEDADRISPDFGGEKIGAKKRAKLEAKAEKKAQREVELKAREDKKKKDAILDEEKRKQDENEKEMERQQEEAERLAREEKERKEHEEYLKMKAAFEVEEEGFEEEENNKESLLKEFVEYIKTNKVVVLEDLAQHFKLKTQAVIDRITTLKNKGTLTGVVDDRGKFIYISETELQAVAKFIKQRGRVSIAELAESSNNLINLVPVTIENC